MHFSDLSSIHVGFGKVSVGVKIMQPLLSWRFGFVLGIAGRRCRHLFGFCRDKRFQKVGEATVFGAWSSGFGSGCAIPKSLWDKEEQEGQAETCDEGNNPTKTLAWCSGFAWVGNYQKTHGQPRDWMMTALTRGTRFLPPRSRRV